MSEKVGAGERRQDPPSQLDPIFQASVVAIRREEEGISVCLITSHKKKRWILPKGIIEQGDSPSSTALKEAFEEAGLLGRLLGDPIGSYQDTKWGTATEVTVFLMEVDAAMSHWAESHMRTRTFVPLAEAEQSVRKSALKEMVRLAVVRLTDGSG